MTETAVPVIRRYSNRKMYDPTISRYVTMRELTGRVRNREAFKVVDVPTGDNITNEVLAQIVVGNTDAIASDALLKFLEGQLA